MIEKIECRKCQAEMKSQEYLNEDGVCTQCVKLGIKTKAEKDVVKDEELTNNIKKHIEVVLEEYGILRRCICGKLYFKRSPAQKSCGGCKFETDNKETK